MPEAEPVKTKGRRGSDKHSTSSSVTSETIHASVGVDGVLDPTGQEMGEAAFQRHVALLGDPRMSQRMYDQQRASIGTQRMVERDVGIGFVAPLPAHTCHLQVQP